MMCMKCVRHTRNECNWLETNMLNCLKEKSLKDDVPKRLCKVENVITSEIVNSSSFGFS